MKFSKLFAVLFIALLASVSTGAEVFLQGNYVEVGIHSSGSFGTASNAPAGFHPKGSSRRLGFVADYDKNGWNVGSPAYSGDYFVPGSPEEGWMVGWASGSETGSKKRFGNFGLVGLSQVTPINLTNTSSGSTQSALWEGEVTSGSEKLHVLQTVSFDENDLFFVIDVVLTNRGTSTIYGVNYFRNVDPDQEQPWTTDFSTINWVEYQVAREEYRVGSDVRIALDARPADNTDKVLAMAVGRKHSLLSLGLGTIDTRAVATAGFGFSNRNPDALLNAPHQPLRSAPDNGDRAISLAYDLGSLAPGQSVSLTYAYILNESDLDKAMSDLASITVLQPTGTISGSDVLFQATTSDIEATTLVEFFANDVKVGEQTTADAGDVFGITFDSRVFDNGTLPLKVKATFDDGRVVEKSTAVSVDNAGPAIEFSAPAAGAVFSGSDLPVGITSLDPAHPAVRVSFFREVAGAPSLFLEEIENEPFETIFSVEDLAEGATVVLKAVAYDEFGHSTTIQTSGTVAVNANPVARAKDVTVYLDENGVVSITAEMVNDSSFDPDSDPITLSLNSSEFSCAELGSNSGILTVTDSKGAVAIASFEITVLDSMKPVPSESVLSKLQGECSVEISAAPTAVDNCAGILTATTTDSLVYTEQGVHIVTWTFDDGNGNVTTQEQIVEVLDVTAPVPAVEMLDTIRGECSAEILSAPKATDNCAGELVGTTTDALVYTEQGVHVVTWTFDDGNGNVTTQTQVVEIIDVTAPVPAVEVLDTVRGECGAEILSAPKAIDNCKGELVGTTTDSLAFAEQGVHVVTWTFDDGNGNVTTQTQVVEIIDVTAPVPAVEVLDTVRGECGGEILSAPKAIDNCKGELIGTTTDSLAFTEQGVHVVTWTFDDGNGNVTTQVQVVEIIDVTAPVPAIEVLDTVRGECGGEILSAPKAIDNCKGELVGTTTDSLVYSEQGVYVVTWTFDDGNGNVTTQEQIVEVLDVTAPVMADIPEDITAELATANGNTISIVLPSATDNCGGPVTVVSDAPAIFPLGTTVVTFTATDENGNVSQATMNVTIEDTTAPVFTSVTINKDTLWPPKHQMEDITVSAVVTDISGERTITAVVRSNEADAGAFPGDIANDITPVTIEQDNGKIDFELRSERDHLGRGRTYSVTLTATDPSGNSSTHELTVFVPVESQEGTWIPYHDYKVGDLVSHDSKTWVCVYTHTSLPHWEPDAPALYFWTEVKYNAVWVTNKVFNVGDVVFHNGSMWKCNFAHTSQGPYKPGTPGIWFWDKL